MLRWEHSAASAGGGDWLSSIQPGLENWRTVELDIVLGMADMEPGLFLAMMKTGYSSHRLSRLGCYEKGSSGENGGDVGEVILDHGEDGRARQSLLWPSGSWCAGIQQLER